VNPSPSQLRQTGLFLAGGCLLVVAVMAVLLGSRLSRGRIPLVCEVRGESISGLSNGAKVQLRGIEVGLITSLGFDPKDPERILVGIDVDRSAPVYKDATATLEIQGITGLKYMELIPGSPSRGLATPGTVIVVNPSMTDRIVDKLDTVAHASAKVLQNLDSLTGTARQAQVDTILMDLRRTSRDLAAMSGGFRAMQLDKRISSVVGHVESATSRIDSTLKVIQPARTMARIDTATIALSAAARRADLMLGRSQGDIYRTLEDLSITMRNLSDFSQSIRDNPGALLRSGDKFRQIDKTTP
jgi:phospholipid/cholesterol/gamma-HCH transport system substrate-binding protein